MADDIPWLTAATFEAFMTAVMYGAEKIPDKWFEKVPGGYFREKEKHAKDKQKKRQDRRARRSSDDDEYDDDDDDDGYQSDDYNARRGRSGDHTRNEYSERDNRGRTRGKSMGAARGFDGSRSEEIPLLAPGVRPRPYNPADYAPEIIGGRQEYYTGRPQDIGGGDGTRYAAPGVEAGVAAAQYMDRPLSSSSSSGPTAGYVPYADVYGEPQHPRQTKLQRDAQRYPHNDNYQSPYQSANPHYRAAYVSSDHSASDSPHSRGSGSSHHHHKERESSRSRNKSRTRARSSVRDRFDPSDKGLGYGAIGALAGGLLGNEAGKGRILPTVAGAVAGGLGANAYESRDRQKKGSRKDSKDSRKTSRYDDRYDDRYVDGRRSSSKRQPRGYDGYYSD